MDRIWSGDGVDRNPKYLLRCLSGWSCASLTWGTKVVGVGAGGIEASMWWSQWGVHSMDLVGLRSPWLEMWLLEGGRRGHRCRIL